MENGNGKRGGLLLPLTTRELIIIIGFVVLLATTLSTRASNADIAALDKRVSTVEDRIDDIRKDQRESKTTLEAINQRLIDVCEKLGEVRGKTK